MKKIWVGLIVFGWALSAAVFAQGDEPVTIAVAVGSVGSEYQLTQTLAQRYMDAHPNVTIKIIQTPEGANDRLGLYLQAFEARTAEFDVLQIDVIWPGLLAENLSDLNEYGGQEIVGQHFEATVEAATVDDRLVAVPWQVGTGLLYYRTDLLEEYGYNGPPETWTELEEMARAIMEGEAADNPDFTGFVWQGQSYEGLTTNALEWIASNNGGRIISQEGEITVFNDRAIEILEQAAGWVGTISPRSVTGFQEEDARNLFQAGNAAFMRNWPYAYSLGNEEGSAIRGKFAISTLPAGSAEGGRSVAALGGQLLAVSRYSQNPEVAADVAFFLASAESQKLRAVEGSLTPTIPALYQDEQVLAVYPFFEEFLEVFTSAVARPSNVVGNRYNEVSRAFFNAVHGVLTGAVDAEAALGELEVSLEEITGLPIGTP